MDSLNLIVDLQTWYDAQCDGDWEHGFGIAINTLDNPGWRVAINLCGTILEDKVFDMKVNLEHETKWIECKVEKNQFLGYGGPKMLAEILQTFLKWAQTEQEWLAKPLPQTLEEQDKEFFQELGREIGPELCKHPNCSRKHIMYSVMCKVHHFEMVKGYLPSFQDII